MYWYVSETKVSALVSQHRRGPFSRVRIKVGALGAEVEAEAEATGDLSRGHDRNLAKLRKHLDRDPSIASFDELTEPGALFRFSGPAASAMSAGRFLLALRGDRHALSLVGSSGNVLGQVREHVMISPSAMPAMAAATFSSGPEGPAEVTGTHLSYEWQLVARRAGGGKAILPSVTGYAVFAGMYPASKQHLRRAGAGHLTHIVVGSPIYVEQI